MRSPALIESSNIYKKWGLSPVDRWSGRNSDNRRRHLISVLLGLWRWRGELNYLLYWSLSAILRPIEYLCDGKWRKIGPIYG